MEKEFTPEKVMGIGKMLGKTYLESLPPKERMKGLKPKERLAPYFLAPYVSQYSFFSFL